MNKSKKIAFVACSNPRPEADKKNIDKLINLLSTMRIEVYTGNLYGSSASDRARELMKCYEDESIDEIYDVSGGDMANEVLRYLNFDVIRNFTKTFCGYSDLTTIINAIYAKTGKSSVLYQIRNFLYIEQKKISYDFTYSFIQGKSMSGVVVGGNIRCLLKLAGTDFWPDMKNKILLLEAMSGKEPQIRTYLAQLQQLNVFDKINGILLGTFTELEREEPEVSVIDLVKEYVHDTMPIAKTKEIGHSVYSKAIVIGKELKLVEE